MTRALAGAVALLVAWQVSTVAPGFAAPSGPRPGLPHARSAFARSIGVVRSRVQLGAQIHLHDGVPVRLWIVRGWTSSDVCASIQIGSRRQLASACGGAAPAAGSIGILIGPTAGGENGAELVGGVAARSTSHVRLQFSGRGSMLVAVRAGAWLAEVTGTHGQARLRSITMLGGRGEPVATRGVAS